jgi:cytolysin-activating lysine-acyltransferase
MSAASLTVSLPLDNLHSDYVQGTCYPSDGDETDMVESHQETLDTLRGAEANALRDSGNRSGQRQSSGYSSIPPTFSSRLGEMVWLLTQSPSHKYLSISDLEWLLMPPLLLGQYKIYHKQNTPIALALWAHLTQEDEERLLAVNKLSPEAWCGGDKQRLLTPVNSDSECTSNTSLNDNTQLWLIELIAPLATSVNELIEKVLADLMATVFKGQNIKLHFTDKKTGRKEVQEIENS